MMPIFLAAGHRVVVPDLIGFGKSDKPKKDSFHHLSFHRQTLLELVDKLDLNNVVLVLQDAASLLGLSLPMAAPQRYGGLLVTTSLLASGEEDSAAYTAPFVDRGHRAACRAFPRMVSETPDAEGAVLASQVHDFWAAQWTGQTLTATDGADQGVAITAEAVRFFG
jgi:tRNA(adenine34) deaminase